MTSRRELTGVVATRYRASTGSDKREVLDEFVHVTGFHRKYAIRVLNRQVSEESMQSCGQVMRLRLLPLEWESVESRDAKGGMHLRGFR